MRKILAVCLLCSSVAACDTLSHELTYRADPDLEPCFLKQFAEWNTALGGNYFTLLAAQPDEIPTITIEAADALPGFFLGATTRAGGSFTIQILSALIPNAGTTLDAIMLHEIGHALGLGHSGNQKDVMYFEPTVLVLSPGDVANVRTLYGLLPQFDLSLKLTATAVRGNRKTRKFSALYPVLWDFGDGSKITMPINYPVAHTFAARGIYTVTATYVGQGTAISVRIK